MAILLHSGDLPREVRAELERRAAARGIRLRQYLVETLAEHTRLPAIGGWLAEVARLPRQAPLVSGVEALEQAREEEGAGGPFPSSEPTSL
ncbi:MAG: hypothetical protein U0002_19975 [Thermoanaerobaculia bacterium]